MISKVPGLIELSSENLCITRRSLGYQSAIHFFRSTKAKDSSMEVLKNYLKCLTAERTMFNLVKVDHHIINAVISDCCFQRNKFKYQWKHLVIRKMGNSTATVTKR